MKTPKEFVLNCTNESFLQRQKNVFDQLSQIGKTPQESMEVERQDEGEDKFVAPVRSSTKSFRGKESIFKTPYDPPSRHFLKRIPDHKKNPHKWTKYSLEDVKDEDMSDRGNTKAALSFLKELSERNDSSIDSKSEPCETVSRKIIFQRHVCTTAETKEIENEDKPSFRSSKVIMPEYVVGQKIKKDRKNKAIKSKGNKVELKLDHLYEEDND